MELKEKAPVSEVEAKGKAALKASRVLVNRSTGEKNKALDLISEQLLKGKDYILQENEKDLHISPHR